MATFNQDGQVVRTQINIGVTKPDGYYDPDSPNYWKLANAKKGHITRTRRVWAPGDTYEVCVSCDQQVNVASDGRHDCDAALLIRENERLTGEIERLSTAGETLDSLLRRVMEAPTNGQSTMPTFGECEDAIAAWSSAVE